MTFGANMKSACDYHWVSEATFSIMAQSWPWGSQIAVKKKKKNRKVNFGKTLWHKFVAEFMYILLKIFLIVHKFISVEL